MCSNIKTKKVENKMNNFDEHWAKILIKLVIAFNGRSKSQSNIFMLTSFQRCRDDLAYANRGM